MTCTGRIEPDIPPGQAHFNQSNEVCSSSGRVILERQGGQRIDVSSGDLWPLVPPFAVRKAAGHEEAIFQLPTQNHREKPLAERKVKGEDVAESKRVLLALAKKFLKSHPKAFVRMFEPLVRQAKKEVQNARQSRPDVQVAPSYRDPPQPSSPKHVIDAALELQKARAAKWKAKSEALQSEPPRRYSPNPNAHWDNQSGH